MLFFTIIILLLYAFVVDNPSPATRLQVPLNNVDTNGS